MARLLSWPLGLRPNSWRLLESPRTIGAAATETLSGFAQTSASPFGGLTIEYAFPNMRGQLARRVRGWIKAMHGGANATRVSICDWDGISLAQMGVSASHAEWKSGQPWTNGEPWSNGQNWSSSPPVVALAAVAAQGDTIVSLADEFWGHGLDMGDWLGFFPFSLGRYEVTEVIEPGTYRLDLPLRTALTTDMYATLRPTWAMRLLSENSAQAQRDAAFLTGLTIQMTEVRDYDVRDWFTD